MTLKKGQMIATAASALALVVGVVIWRAERRGEERESAPARQEEGKASRGKPRAGLTVPGPLLRFAPTDRQDVAYGFTMEAEAAVKLSAFVPAAWSDMVDTQGQGMVPVRLTLTGTLALRYYAAGLGEWEVAARILDPSHQLNGKAPIFSAALGYPFAFRMDSRGQLSHFRFARGTPAEAEKAMQSVVQGAQVVLPAEEQTRWETKETDEVGTYAAVYELAGSAAQPADGVEIRKTKERYLELRAASLGLNDIVAGMQAEVYDTTTRATVRPGGAWVLELREEGKVVQRAHGETLSESRSRLHLWRVESAGTPFPDRFAAFDHELHSGKYVQEQLHATDPELNKMGQGLDLVDALSKYVELTKTKKKQLASEFLINYLRQDPANAERLVAALLADKDYTQYDKSTQLHLWMLLAKAGYPEAQQALWSAVADARNSDQTRTLVMANVGQIEYPEATLVDQVWEMYNGTTSAADGVSKDLKAMSILALGLLGSRDKLNDDVKPVIGQRLVEALQGAGTSWDEQMALRGIGNYGNADLLDAVAPFFHSNDANVRATAFSALRKMDEPRAQAILIEQYQQESSGGVRLVGLDALQRMPLAPPTLDWVREQALSTTDEREQIALVNVLGKTLPADRSNEVTLRQILATSAPAGVRKAVFRYVKP